MEFLVISESDPVVTTHTHTFVAAVARDLTSLQLAKLSFYRGSVKRCEGCGSIAIPGHHGSLVYARNGSRL
jgi:hypothetical protein